MIYDDPFQGQTYRRLIDMQRPPNNATQEYLMKRLETRGSLRIVDASPEERALLNVMAARGIVRLEGDTYVMTVMG